jgi:myo-inositol-1-phosphate synthase
MQIKIDFLCREFDPCLIVLTRPGSWICKRAGMWGVQARLFIKSPMTAPGLYPEHDLFIQLMKLKNTLRHLKGEELITHLGLEYYD